MSGSVLVLQISDTFDTSKHHFLENHLEVQLQALTCGCMYDRAAATGLYHAFAFLTSVGVIPLTHSTSNLDCLNLHPFLSCSLDCDHSVV